MSLTVTDAHARILRPGFESRAPRTAAEFAEYYDNSDMALLNRTDMEHYRRTFVGNGELAAAYKLRAKAEHAKTARPNSSYIISIPMQTRALMLRRVQILRGGILAQAIQTR